MKGYADSSFLGQLLVPDFASAAAASAYQRLGRPPLMYTGLHGVEITNMLRLRVFAAGSAALRSVARREAEMGRRRLLHLFHTGKLQKVGIDFDGAVMSAEDLSRLHTEKLGARTMDILHVAAALLLHARVFLTCDLQQAKLAVAAGLEVKHAGPA